MIIYVIFCYYTEHSYFFESYKKNIRSVGFSFHWSSFDVFLLKSPFDILDARNINLRLSHEKHMFF